MKVAIIPARGGSRRIPRKNIKHFDNLPMVAWSIRAARASGCFDRIIVSTDDQEISAVAAEYGAETPFVRPKELSDDHTGTIPVIAHAVRWLEQQGQSPRYVCCIYATAPFLRPDDLMRGLEIIQCTGVDFALSVTTYPFPIQRAIRITREHRLEMFNPEHFNTRSQDLEEAWHDAGQFYWGTAQAWLSGKSLFGQASAPVPLPRHRVQDIDTPEDWIFAELMFKSINLQREKYEI